MDYEDFVEGIKPELSEEDDGRDTVVYRLQSGIFKAICEKAKLIKKSNFEDAYARFMKDLQEGNYIGKVQYYSLEIQKYLHMMF